MINKNKNIDLNSLPEKYILVNEIQNGGDSFVISPKEADLKTIELMLPENITLKSFSALGEVSWLPGDDILELKGKLKAEIETFCCISGDKMILPVEDDILIQYTKGANHQYSEDISCQLIEIIEGGKIDIFNAVVQSLILSIPLCPSLENSKLPKSVLELNAKYCDDVAKDKTNPFEVLKDVRSEKNNND